ncbi:hypothetical protein [Burkholderia cepacia]|uniref:hypothetical protein n=1 Tax=Burkholderia cepacia TaxID=292 RepID=UPI00299081DC|nr:hypothetical protein [Burkholderia cepacia]
MITPKITTYELDPSITSELNLNHIGGGTAKFAVRCDDTPRSGALHRTLTQSVEETPEQFALRFLEEFKAFVDQYGKTRVVVHDRTHHD